MSVYFEELDFRPTPMGALSLRRRRHLGSGLDVYEIKLGDEFLMSSAFTVAEIALARLGLAALIAPDLDVVVGGLGLGYTAQAVLENPRRAILDRGRRAGRGHRMARAGSAAARQATHRRSALPLRSSATSSRCRIPQTGSMPRARAAASMRCWSISTTRRTNLLHPRHAALYAPAGLERLADASASRRRVRAVVERSAGSMRSNACWPAPSQPRLRMS